jgi:hypothetical protein
MREQQTFEDIEFDSKKRKTRREVFLERIRLPAPYLVRVTGT